MTPTFRMTVTSTDNTVTGGACSDYAGTPLELPPSTATEPGKG